MSLGTNPSHTPKAAWSTGATRRLARPRQQLLCQSMRQTIYLPSGYSTLSPESMPRRARGPWTLTGWQVCAVRAATRPAQCTKTAQRRQQVVAVLSPNNALDVLRRFKKSTWLSWTLTDQYLSIECAMAWLDNVQPQPVGFVDGTAVAQGFGRCWNPCVRRRRDGFFWPSFCCRAMTNLALVSIFARITLPTVTKS